MKKIILTIALILSFPTQADNLECTVIALSMFTSKNIELNGCGVTGNTSAKALNLFGNCTLSADVLQKVMFAAKTDVAAMNCLKSRETYTNLTNALINK